MTVSFQYDVTSTAVIADMIRVEVLRIGRTAVMDMLCKQYLGTAALLDSRLDIGTCVIDRRRERQPALEALQLRVWETWP
jgi:hypothetical protein